MYILSSKNRKEETVMARLHIGHSFLTHSFLLKGKELPVCIGCDKRLTIEIILLTCSDFIEIRESHFTAKSLRMLFRDISPEKILNVLKEINMFGKNNNLRSFLVMVMFSPFKHGFKTVYRSILRHTHY